MRVGMVQKGSACAHWYAKVRTYDTVLIPTTCCTYSVFFFFFFSSSTGGTGPGCQLIDVMFPAVTGLLEVIVATCYAVAAAAATTAQDVVSILLSVTAVAAS